MKRGKLNTILEYIELNNNRPLGASVYASLIVMINNEEKIVEELLDKDNWAYNNLLTFLDYGLQDVISGLDRNSKHFNDTLIGSIYYVLGAFDRLDKDTKDKINGTAWLKYLNKGYGTKRDALKEVYDGKDS